MMQNSRIPPQRWISLPIEPEQEVHAKQMRAERDQQYRNIYTEAATDERWVGDLGEMVFNCWFKNEGIQNFQWIVGNAAGQPDFVTASGIRIGVKTVKRKVPPREGYTAQITAQHAAEPIHQFFFMTYEINKRLMWLLGGIDRDRFLQEARYYGSGQQVHVNYTVRKGHEIYNIEVAKLIPPKDWIKQIT